MLQSQQTKILCTVYPMLADTPNSKTNVQNSVSKMG